MKTGNVAVAPFLYFFGRLKPTRTSLPSLGHVQEAKETVGLHEPFPAALGFWPHTIRITNNSKHPTTKSLWLLPKFRVTSYYSPEQQQSSWTFIHPLPLPGRPPLPSGQCWTDFCFTINVCMCLGTAVPDSVSQNVRTRESSQPNNFSHVIVSFFWKINLFFSIKTVFLKIENLEKNLQIQILQAHWMWAYYLPDFTFLGMYVLYKAIIQIFLYPFSLPIIISLKNPYAAIVFLY